MIPEHYLFGSLFYAFIDRLFYKTALEAHTHLYSARLFLL